MHAKELRIFNSAARTTLLVMASAAFVLLAVYVFRSEPPWIASFEAWLHTSSSLGGRVIRSIRYQGVAGGYTEAQVALYAILAILYHGCVLAILAPHIYRTAQRNRAGSARIGGYTA